MRIRNVAVAGVLLLVAGGCSSGDDPIDQAASIAVDDGAQAPAGGDSDQGGSTATFAGSAISDRQWAVVRSLATAHGPDDGFAAQMLAFERGYDVVQIADAAVAAQLDVDGRIDGGGGPLSPSGSRAGIVLLPEEDEGDGEGASAADTGELTLASFQRGQIERARLFADLVSGAAEAAPDLFLEARNFDITTADPTVAAALILALAESGYSPAQITDALTQQTVLGLDTIGQEAGGIGGVEGPCAALYDESTGTLLGPAGFTGLDCGQVVSSLSAPAVPPTPDPAAPTPVPVAPESATYSGEASAAALDGTKRDSGGYGALSFEARVDTGTADFSLSYTYFSWIRGGEDGGPSGDQNCGIIVAVTGSGSGASGSPTEIPLTVVSFDLVDTVGALCDGQDFSFHLRDPGDGLGRFVGQLNGLGLSGEYTGTFQTNRIQLEASPK